MRKTFSYLLEALPKDSIIAVIGEAPGRVAVTAPVVEAHTEVKRGGVFVARVGGNRDGHAFIPNALKQGAVAIVGEQPLDVVSHLLEHENPIMYVQVHNARDATGYLAAAYHDHPAKRLAVIGVTGTDGKTTSSTLLHAALKGAGFKTGLISTIAADVGAAAQDTGLHVTTPSAPAVQALLAQMVANGLTHAVLEVTSHGLHQGRLHGVDLDVAVITNLTHEHLDYHKTFENYRAAKGKLFEMLTTTTRKPNLPKVAVVNADDPNADFFASFRADRVQRYGLLGDQSNRISASNIRYSPDGIYFDVIGASPEPMEFKTALVGEFNVMNILAALSAARVFTDDLAALRDGIASIKHVSGRMERIDEGQLFTALVDFAHTPNALKRALEAARTMRMGGSRVIAVFGSAGLRDVEKRRLMAEVSAQLADYSIFTAEDPRTESLDGILAVMAAAAEAQGGREGYTFERVPDRGRALYRACRMARPGDIVIACGKGHEQSMCFGETEYPWDDREGMRAALRGQPLKTLPTA
jgi:UDP-N-acetylmuramoyl-L-alanyl-D-glutamate--2,6-diaminopimelate ligase